MKKVIAFVVLPVVMLISRAEEGPPPPTLFVAPFDGKASALEFWQPAVGEGLAEMLITEITKTERFQVLESTGLEDLKDEIELGEKGWVATEEKVEKGGWAGADFMFRGKVTRFGSKKQGLGLGGFAPKALGNLGVQLTKADVRIDWRVVDVANRKVVGSGQAVGQETGVGFDIGLAINKSGGQIGFDNQEFMASALGKATVKALDGIIADVKVMKVPVSGRAQARAAEGLKAEQVQENAAVAARTMPGKVLAAPGGGVVIVSLGSVNGLKAGDTLKLFETIEIKDEDGKVVFTDEKLVGEVVLDAVQEDRSKGTCKEPPVIKAGWIVKSE